MGPQEFGKNFGTTRLTILHALEQPCQLAGIVTRLVSPAGAVGVGLGFIFGTEWVREHARNGAACRVETLDRESLASIQRFTRQLDAPHVLQLMAAIEM